MIAGSLALGLFRFSAAQAAAKSDGYIPGGAGRLHLIRRAGQGKPVLMVHPFSPGCAAAFDVPGLSWIEDLAGRGRDVWALDLRGFGGSDRPAEMERPPAEGRPVVRAKDGEADVATAVTHILQTTGASRIDVVGWSFGSVLAAMFSGARPELVERLVLLGSMHAFDLPFMAELFELPGHPGELNPNMPAYRVVTPEAALGHWRLMRKDLPAATVDEATVKLIEATAQASDPASAPKIRQPTGPLVDLHEIWCGRPVWDAASIRASVLVIRGSHDLFADHQLTAKLTSAAHVREAVIPDATHWVLYEKQRGRLLAEAGDFLAG